MSEQGNARVHAAVAAREPLAWARDDPNNAHGEGGDDSEQDVDGFLGGSGWSSDGSETSSVAGGRAPVTARGGRARSRSRAAVAMAGPGGGGAGRPGGWGSVPNLTGMPGAAAGKANEARGGVWALRPGAVAGKAGCFSVIRLVGGSGPLPVCSRG